MAAQATMMTIHPDREIARASKTLRCSKTAANPPIRQSANPPIRQSANPPIRQSANPPIRHPG
jgi:hypothetical protein